MSARPAGTKLQHAHSEIQQQLSVRPVEVELQHAPTTWKFSALAWKYKYLTRPCSGRGIGQRTPGVTADVPDLAVGVGDVCLCHLRQVHVVCIPDMVQGE